MCNMSFCFFLLPLFLNCRCWFLANVQVLLIRLKSLQCQTLPLLSQKRRQTQCWGEIVTLRYSLNFPFALWLFIFFITTLCVFRSSSVDVPPVETVVPSETLHEDVDIKETAADVIEEKVEQPPTPAVVRPPHTSPDLSFASEVTSQK